jgi:hypothetical protein
MYHDARRGDEQRTSTVKHILITGAAGAIGTALRRGLAGVYPLLRLSDADKHGLSVACLRIGSFCGLEFDGDMGSID